MRRSEALKTSEMQMKTGRFFALTGPTTGLLGLVLATATSPCLAQATPQAAAQTVREPLVGDDAKDESNGDLARQLQNPVGDLISFPLVNNTNFGYGPHNGTKNVLQLQPVVPFHITDDWNLITRTVLPVVWNPDLSPFPTVPVGTGPTSFTAFLAPKDATNGFLWGAGPVVQIPTISSATLGSNVWGGGPSAVIVYMTGPWVAGVLANAIWSLSGTRSSSYSTFLGNPFVAYNFDDGWYVTSGPNIIANWQAAGTKWTVPAAAAWAGPSASARSRSIWRSAPITTS
jgi:hypothetical protein